MAVEGTEREQGRAAESVPSLFLPSLLSGIDDGDTTTTRTAGYGLALLTQAYPSTVSEVTSELVGRLATDTSRQTVRRTLASVSELDEEVVRETLREEVGGEYARELYADIDGAEPWDLSARLSADGGDPEEFLTDFRTLVQLDDRSESTPEMGETDVVDASESPDDEDAPGERDEDDEDVAAAPSAAESSGGTGRTSRAVLTKRERIERAEESETFQTIAFRSAFDDLEVVAPETERRYANVLRARGTIEDTERGIALRLLTVPDEDRSSFDPAVSDQIQAWTRLAPTDGVVTVVDWGENPQPWVATEYIEETLAARGRVDPRRALKEARALAATLVKIHQQKVVHGGIDPKNVVYPANTMGGGRPMLDNVGLISPYRRQFDPADYLDPRYAAPEYYDSQYGGFDHATDIYQLGMVTYRLCTGRHPFDGSYASVRESVLGDRPPAPSEVVPALPSAVDEVVAKATAKQKLTRYETVNDFYHDLTRICKAVLE